MAPASFSQLLLLAFILGLSMFPKGSSFFLGTSKHYITRPLSYEGTRIYSSETKNEVGSEEMTFLDEDDDGRVVSLSDNALVHLKELQEKQGTDQLYLRMGVKSGGCSGMSYVMDFMEQDEVAEDDHIETWEEYGIQCAIDPKSLLYLYGLQLDYSDELIGGGFEFKNPNAESTCGCGKSFGV
eukprot:CAMPEP_0113943540 /NCGR_PEP_ID=MMETSP1339-20121228/25850_1 /TAXON_ID=94617 /ORGANISM="Fibrocapsa japonica" /LENGTH=182 /DNA_ID=CAMNT_0000948441 /DNA_START=82 /DNA_END=630 /DNA_ORIENTATION=+ /assembly_acc=CAM_ASM_000762